jgi:SSS family solute:Na+ symporter
MTLGILFAYLLLVLIIGAFSHRLFKGTGEDYFLATRTIGPFVLLMSLFGTHMTAFSLLGASGEAYHLGVGVFSLMASSSALVTPCVIFLLGPRLWKLGKRHGYVTQIQYFRDRWNCDAVGLLLFVSLVGLLFPYLLIGVMGGGITLAGISGGQIPEWFGGLLVCSVVLAYVTYGGLRGTAWANTFQTLVFMSLGVGAFILIVRSLGGFSLTMEQVVEQRPDLLVRGERIQPLFQLSYTLIPLSAGMFPHLFMHWLSARSKKTFRIPVIFYPICIAVVWLPSVLMGVFGTLQFPGLEGPEANSIMVRMISAHAPEILTGLLGAGVLAAVMSSLDSQVLSVGTMFTQDIVRHFGFHDRMSERGQILAGRIFVVLILVSVYLLSLVSDRSIFRLGIWAFTGFAALFPVVLAALFWRRSTKYGAMASILAVAFSWTYFFFSFEGQNQTIGDTGILPVVLILAASALAMIVGSLVTKAPEQEHLLKFFSEVDRS